MRLLVLAPQSSPRLHYTLRFCFEALGFSAIEYTDSPAHFLAAKDRCRLNLSLVWIEGIAFLPCGNFLLENQIKPQTIGIEWLEGLPIAFRYESQPRADLPFDIWAWVFYQISRYEEYLPFAADEHGRFSAAQSLAQQQGFLQIPVVDKCLLRLKDILQKYGINAPQSPMNAQFLPTYDIDYAYAYLAKGGLRQLAALGKRCLKMDWAAAKQQLAVWRGKQRDPYDTFDYLEALDAKNSSPPIYFWLVGNYGKYDKNCLPQNAQFRALLRRNADKYEVGWHPSYRSNEESLDYAAAELQGLRDIIGRDIVQSRQHFLRLRFPQTYRRLLDLGIRADYSMGYADALGFRAGTARSFYWYDLSKEEETALRVFPFVIMEVTLKNYLHYAPEQALAQALKMKEIAMQSGFCSMIWHNNSLCEQEGWQGWRKVLEALM